MSDYLFLVSEEQGNLFQFDVEQPNLQELQQFCIDQISNWLGDTPHPCYKEGVSIFELGQTLDLDFMVWLEPGYFILAPVTLSFDRVYLAKRAGKDIASYQVKGSTTLNFLAGEESNYVVTARFDKEGLVFFEVVVQVVTAIMAFASAELLNSVPGLK